MEGGRVNKGDCKKAGRRILPGKKDEGIGFIKRRRVTLWGGQSAKDLKGRGE